MQQEDNSEVLQVEKMDEHDAFSETFSVLCALRSHERTNPARTQLKSLIGLCRWSLHIGSLWLQLHCKFVSTSPEFRTLNVIIKMA